MKFSIIEWLILIVFVSAIGISIYFMVTSDYERPLDTFKIKCEENGGLYTLGGWGIENCVFPPKQLTPDR